MWIFLIISLLVVSLTLNYKVQFFGDAIAQLATPELKANVSRIGNGTSSFTPNITSSNQTLNLTTDLFPGVPETPPSPDKPSHDGKSYIVPNKTSVQANNSGLIGASCDEGDGLVIGGYSLNTSSDGGRSLSNVIISANFPMISNVTMPVQQKVVERATQPQSPIQEGWTTGVINNGDRPLELVVNALCLNLNK